MTKNPLWIPFCALYALRAVQMGFMCIDGGGVTYALLSLMDVFCFGWGYAKLRGLSLWP